MLFCIMYCTSFKLCLISANILFSSSAIEQQPECNCNKVLYCMFINIAFIILDKSKIILLLLKSIDNSLSHVINFNY